MTMMHNSPSGEPDDAGPTCEVCGEELQADEEACWKCYGECGWHDCGEDVCVCLNKEEITVTCDECGGIGRALLCPNRCEKPCT